MVQSHFDADGGLVRNAMLDEFAVRECTRCGRESDDLADGMCVVCRDHEADEFTDYNGGGV